MTQKDPEAKNKKGIFPRSINSEMRESYLDYAMSVITARALPDVRDGLKPVHRRILYTMQQMGLTSTAKSRKSAAVVGDVMGKYHPHGDAAIYDSLVQMAQDFKLRYPLIIGQGNFGSIDGDPAAAMRYSEAKMSKLAGELLRDLEKDTVEWRPNYDATKREPVVLPAVAPNLLLNGTLGIAVGMATNIPPHNLNEVVEAIVYLIDNKDASTEDLLRFIKAPDFPTGGVIFGEEDLHHAYANGKGGVVVRGEAEIVELSKGETQIVITSIPYRVNKADLIESIANLVRDKKLEGIKGLRDESTKDIRIVIDLKGSAYPQKVLNYIYKHTSLEDTFHFNMVALDDGVPRTFSLKAILEKFVEHRRVVVERRTRFDLSKALDREHILLGLKKALDHIDKIIKTIRAAQDVGTAHAALMKQFKFSDRQATAILEMRLQKLAGLERKKIENELKDVQKLIGELRALLASQSKILGVIKDELKDLAVKYGDDRRTRVVRHGAKVISVEDMIPDEENVLVLTSGGYIKRTNPSEYRKQRRGGVGVIDLNTKEEDFVTTLLTASTHSDLLFFTDKGKVYQTKMYDVPEGRRATRGKSVMNFLSLAGDEKVTSILAMPKTAKQQQGLSLMMVTKQGVVKKVAAKSFHDVRRSGLMAIKLGRSKTKAGGSYSQRGEANDQLISAFFVCSGDEVVITTIRGQSIRFKASAVREMGRSAAGVRGIKLAAGDYVVGAGRIEKGVNNQELLVISEKGYGKKTKLKEYKVQGRGGSGIKTFKITPKTGALMISRVVKTGTEDEDGTEVVAISKRGQVIRIDLSEIPTLGRATQGVRMMKLKSGDGIASVVCL
jgi:DNA gyrase subunit A